MKKLAISFSALVIMACGTSFEQIRGVTRIELRDNQNRQLAVIENAQQIAATMSFVNARSDGWKVPWYGVPVPTLVADLYADKTLVAHFGAGANFFECQRAGGFYSRAASETELAEFERLVGAKRKQSR